MSVGLSTFAEFLEQFNAHQDFAYTKINHGFWEGLADAYSVVGRPVPPNMILRADEVADRWLQVKPGDVEEAVSLLTYLYAENSGFRDVATRLRDLKAASR